MYLLDGSPIAWITLRGDIYAFGGEYLGWFADGACWDVHGCGAIYRSRHRTALGVVPCGQVRMKDS